MAKNLRAELLARTQTEELVAKDLGVFGTALGVPPIVEMHWGARLLPIPDPFGSNLRISEPVDTAAHAHVSNWGRLSR